MRQTQVMLRCSYHYGHYVSLYFVLHVMVAKQILENCMLSIFISNYSSLYWQWVKDSSGNVSIHVQKPASPESLNLEFQADGRDGEASGQPATLAGDLNRGHTISKSLSRLKRTRKTVRHLSPPRPVEPSTRLSGILMASKAANKFRKMLKTSRLNRTESPSGYDSPTGMDGTGAGPKGGRPQNGNTDAGLPGNVEGDATSFSFQGIDHLGLPTELNQPYRMRARPRQSGEEVPAVLVNQELQSIHGSRRSLSLGEIGLQRQYGQQQPDSLASLGGPTFHIPKAGQHRRSSREEVDHGQLMMTDGHKPSLDYLEKGNTVPRRPRGHPSIDQKPPATLGEGQTDADRHEGPANEATYTFGHISEQKRQSAFTLGQQLPTVTEDTQRSSERITINLPSVNGSKAQSQKKIESAIVKPKSRAGKFNLGESLVWPFGNRGSGQSDPRSEAQQLGQMKRASLHPSSGTQPPKDGPAIDPEGFQLMREKTFSTPGVFKSNQS